MRLVETLRIALRSLRSNRLRSALTMVGIIIGIAAVVVLVALGNGIQAGFNEQFASLTKMITITPTEGDGSSRPLTDDDVEELMEPAEAPSVALVSPQASGSVLIRADGVDGYRAAVTGTTATYPAIVDLEMSAGTFFNEQQERSGARVAVLGQGTVDEIFGGDAAQTLGRTLRIGRSSFRVIGVAKSGEKSDVVMMPLKAARSYVLGGGENADIDQILVSATSGAQLGAAQSEVTSVLTRRHHISDVKKRDFEISTEQDVIERTTQSLSFLTLFTGAIAGISLLVGGIGVVNIMLVSVTERTREIGLRKAIGATRRDILQQFLVEATALAGLGGVAGVLVGVGLSVTAGVTLPKAAPDFPPPIVSPLSIAVAVAVSMTIGLVAGGYPAHRAARLRPIEALRSD